MIGYIRNHRCCETAELRVVWGGKLLMTVTLLDFFYKCRSECRISVASRSVTQNLESGLFGYGVSIPSSKYVGVEGGNVCLSDRFVCRLEGDCSLFFVGSSWCTRRTTAPTIRDVTKPQLRTEFLYMEIISQRTHSF